MNANHTNMMTRVSNRKLAHRLNVLFGGSRTPPRQSWNGLSWSGSTCILLAMLLTTQTVDDMAQGLCFHHRRQMRDHLRQRGFNNREAGI